MLIELLRQDTPELMRRWVNALLIAPEHERQTIVEAVEAQLVETYATPVDEYDQPIASFTADPVRRDGYTETVTRDYSRPKPSADAPTDAPGDTPGDAKTGTQH